MDASRFHGDNNNNITNEIILLSLKLQLHLETSPVVFCNTLKLLTSISNGCRERDYVRA